MTETGLLVLARHGETEWSLSGRHTGVTDLPLTEHGEEEARAIAGVLGGHPFALALVSPRQRARRTAELAGYPDAQVDEDLAEWDYGAYEGRTSDDIMAELGHHWNLWVDGVPAGETPGESALDVRRRVERVIAQVDPVLQAGGDVLLVAHGHLLRALGGAWLGLAPEAGRVFSLATATVSVLGFEHGERVVKRWNVPPLGLRL